MRLILTGSQQMLPLTPEKYRARLQACLGQTPTFGPASLTNLDDDPEARACLEQAFLRTYRWPKDFRGFMAGLLVYEEGRVFHESVSVALPQGVAATLPDSDMHAWAQETLAMMVPDTGT